MSVKILLTGASGLVGAAFARAAGARHEVVGVVGNYPHALAGLHRQESLNLADRDAAARVIRAEEPDAIVNCAAVSEPALCEREPEKSHALNVNLPELLAELASELDARLVHISSEQVFDGARPTPYAVEYPPHPINLYGRQKLASERAVAVLAPAHAAVVRAPLLMGDSPGGRRGLHERLLADWEQRRTARLYVDEFRQPCTAQNLAEVLLELVERKPLCGVFHWAGVELLSRYELGLRVRERFRLNETAAPIEAVRRADRPDVSAQRQPCLALDLSPLVGELTTRPQTIAEQLCTLAVPPQLRGWYDCARSK